MSNNPPSPQSKNKIVRHIKRWWQWYALGLGLIVTLGLGTWGFYWNSLVRDEKLTCFDALYRALQLFVLQSGAVPRPVGWQLEIARILAPIVGFLAGAKALFAIFYKGVQLLLLKWKKSHIIICGAGRIGLRLAKKMRANGERVVVIEKDELNDGIPLCRDLGATVLIGDATQEEMLKKAGVAKAKYLFAVSGNDETNMTIADSANEASKNRKTPLPCMVHILNPYFSHLLTWHCLTSGKSDKCHLEFFNILRNGVRLLIKEHSPFGDSPTRPPPYILIIGWGHFIRLFIERLAREWYHKKLPEDEPLKIYLLGSDAEDIKNELIFSYNKFEKVCDLVPYKIDVSGVKFEKGDFISQLDGISLIKMVYVCLENPAKSIEIALKLARLRMMGLGGQTMKIIAVADQKTELITSQEIEIFELLEKTCDPNLLFNGHIKTIADLLLKDPAFIEGVPSTSAVRHLIQQMQDIGCYLMPLLNWDAKSFKFSPQEIDRMARMGHEEWLKEAQGKGWRHAPNYDEANKKSPMLKGWEELEDSKKDAYRRWIAKIPSILEEADFEIYRLYYELFAQKLHQYYRDHHRIIGPNRPEALNFQWEKLGQPLQQWYREKANRIIKGLRDELCYKIEPADGGITPIKLTPDEIERLCEMENENWDSLSAQEKEEQRNCARRLPGLLAELGFNVSLNIEEAIARAFHLQWIESKKKSGFTPETEPFMVPWHKLPEYKKESNREAAEDIPAKLKVIGCGIRKRTDPNAKLLEFTESEIEIMAEMEHERWFREQKKNGWALKETSEVELWKLPQGVDFSCCYPDSEPRISYDPVRRVLVFNGIMSNEEREKLLALSDVPSYTEAIKKLYSESRRKDVENKRNPFMRPWDELPEDVKQYDRDQVKIIPQVLAYVDQEVYRVHRERIARAIHEEYLKEQAKLGQTRKTNPFMVPWEELPEEKKDSNRESADHIITKLHAIGCKVREKTDPNAQLFEFTQEEVEKIAKMEHERWLNELLSKGWTYAPGKKDVEKKTNPYLVPWEQLPEEIKEIDRALVRVIPKLLAQVGLEVYRIKNL